MAVGLTVLSYLVLTVNDALALRYARRRLPYHQLAFASFVGYAFSCNATIVGGSAARYRIYSALGLSGGEIARMVLFCSYPVWLGYFLVTGTLFVLQPPATPTGIPISHLGFRVLGLACWAALGVYMSVVLLRRRPLAWRGWQLRVPSAPLSVGQIAVTAIDWLLAAAVLYVLLPGQMHVAFPRFLGLFMIGQGVGMISHVPGSLGVFETVLLYSLSEGGAAAAGPGEVSFDPTFVAALLLYRLIYYILPLLLAALLLAVHAVVPRGPLRETLIPRSLPLDAAE
jgi:uncharacterized membrane protein YbhN (UPF0104 family)